ncbi:hypothetical protein EC991_001410 [Linnemannia zychae]|nr:hypothetical protein EC991_001410 [Linnemannia zychae]
MPSITLNNPEDKATVKRFLSSPNTRIITATVARLYIAYPDPSQWTYAGILGAVALIQTSNTFFLRIVDLLYGQGIVWEQELYQGFAYHQDMPFFHTFQADNYVAGFSFADEHEAEVFYSKVNGRARLRPSSSGTLAKSAKAGGAQGRNKFPLHNGKLDKSRIGMPSDFRHVGHIGWDPDVGFEAQNIDPAWRTLFDQLDTFGVSRQQINENAAFITTFVNAHGGLAPKQSNGTTNNSNVSIGNNGSASDLSRIDSPPPMRAQSPPPPKKRPPPPPPPPANTSSSNQAGAATAPLVSPAPYHGYLPRPLAQVMASLSFGSSPFYGNNSSSPQSPRTPSPQEGEKVVTPTAVSPSTVPPPPPPPPPMVGVTQKQEPKLPLTISTSNNNRQLSSPPASASVSSSTSNHNPQPIVNAIKSPVESSLLASIRESGGLQGLRKTGALRSPPPRSATIAGAIGNRPSSPTMMMNSSNSQGDLVSALVAALHRRQTKLTYSEDESGAGSESDDGWDADD